MFEILGKMYKIWKYFEKGHVITCGIARNKLQE